RKPWTWLRNARTLPASPLLSRRLMNSASPWPLVNTPVLTSAWTVRFVSPACSCAERMFSVIVAGVAANSAPSAALYSNVTVPLKLRVGTRVRRARWAAAISSRAGGPEGVGEDAADEATLDGGFLGTESGCCVTSHILRAQGRSPGDEAPGDDSRPSGSPDRS